MKALRFNRNLLAVVHDLCMAGLSFVLAVYIRLGGSDQMNAAKSYLLPGSLLFMLVCLAVFASMRFYRGLWRYASMRDLVTIIRAVSLSVLIFAVVVFLVNRLEGMPRSVLFINWMLLLFLLGGPRFAYRAMKERTLKFQMSMSESAKIPVLLIGANDSAERFIRDMSRDERAPFEVVAIADSDPKQKNRTIHRVPIYDGPDHLQVIVNKLARKGKRPQKIIVADSTISGVALRNLLSVADGFGIPLARLPKPSEIKTGVSEKLDVQPIAIEDLLGRSQNVLDRASMQKLVENEVVLVTGCGGTIGSELSRQIASYKPSKLLLVEMSEFNLYQIERELRGRFPELSLSAILADVRDSAHIRSIFQTLHPSLVFHAAAIKHVPMAESNVEEALLTNVFGTQNVAEACVAFSAKAMVMISTDKAVNPTNVMGASKRLAEIFCQALGEANRSKNATRFITVRFGNVLGSTGSVVPLFQEQLSKGGPLTVTHPEMTRYFMTTREAVELVLQAASMGVAMAERHQFVFVLDMGQPVRILDLALQMIKLAGLRPYEDIKITYSGIRPGEKLFEELFYFGENVVKTSHESIMLASPQFMELGRLQKAMTKLHTLCKERRKDEAQVLLCELVPEFKHAH